MKKESWLFLLTGLAACLLSGCNDGKYERTPEGISFTEWTFSFGTLAYPLKDVNADAFEDLTDWLGRDDSHVYFKQHLVKEADAATLKADKYPLYHDNNDYFYMTSRMHVADMKTFKVIRRFERDLWAKDSRYAYFDSLRIEEADVASFKMKSDIVAVDKNHVYYFGKILPLADPKTFDPDWKGAYSRDKSHIWYCDEMLEDVDYESFDVDKEGNAHDKIGPFRGSKRVSASEEEPIEEAPSDSIP